VTGQVIFFEETNGRKEKEIVLPKRNKRRLEGTVGNKKEVKGTKRKFIEGKGSPGPDREQK
jgi:hypothetical protein